MTTLVFNKLPAALPAFGRVAMARGRKDPKLSQPIVAEARGVKATKAAVAAYRKVVGGPDLDTLPILYPEVMALPLQLHIMAHPDFPLAAMGLVHLTNTVEQRRPLVIGEAYDVRVAVNAIERTSRGYEFKFEMTYTAADGVEVWRCEAGVVSLRKAPGDKAKSGARKDVPERAPVLESWTLAAGLGRRYARVSGDFNPIHLTAPTAKLLGFKRAIIHGMWTLGHAAAALPVDTDGCCRLEASFKTPLFLPGKASLHGASTDAGFDFEVADSQSGRPILVGRVNSLEGAA